MNKEYDDNQIKAEMRSLMFAVYDGQSFQIGKMISLCQQALFTKGMEAPGVQKCYNLFYSLKNELEEKGLIKVIKQGTYYISSEGVDDYTEEDSEEICDEDMHESETEISPETTVYGEGTGIVYLYYYPSYRELAMLKGENDYRCKIGCTTIGTKRRFSSTSKTEEPEHREIALMIKTDKPGEVEKLLHAALIVSGKQLKDTPGREWFLCNPAFVLDLYKSIVSFVDPKDEYNVSAMVEE